MEQKTILHINTQLRSGSVTIPYRIHEGFLEQGYNSIFLTAYCDDVTNYQNVIEIPKQHLSIIVARIIRNVWYGKIMGKDTYYFFPQISMRTTSIRTILKQIKEPPSLIIAYWTNFYFTQELIHKISQHFHAPVLYYLMDEEPYTGGCHMTFKCNGYMNGCGNCRALKVHHKKDISYRSVRKKKKWVNRTKMIPVAASSFTYERLSRSFIFEKKQKELVLLPINEHIFQPDDKVLVRKELGIPLYKKVVLFGGASFERINKGMIYLIQALGYLKEDPILNKEIHVVLIGNGQVVDRIPFEYTHLGYLDTTHKIAQAYQCCDVFVCPTIQDAGPTMINEAMMCGRPVVSFDIGVARDLIVPTKTGYIAKTKNARDLAEGIRTILKCENLELMNQACREIAKQKCSMSIQIDRLIELGEMV